MSIPRSSQPNVLVLAVFFSYLNVYLTTCRMLLILHFKNSAYGVMIIWSSRVGLGHRKWASGHLWKLIVVYWVLSVTKS